MFTQIKEPTINFKCCTSLSINYLNNIKSSLQVRKQEMFFFWQGEVEKCML